MGFYFKATFCLKNQTNKQTNKPKRTQKTKQTSVELKRQSTKSQIPRGIDSFEVTRNMPFYSSCGSCLPDLMHYEIVWEGFLLFLWHILYFSKELLCFLSLF